MNRRSAAVLVVVAGGLCAGLLWASQGLTDRVRRPSNSRASAPASAEPDARPHAGATFSARPRGRAGVASPSMLTVSLEQPTYSMAAPEFLSDPAASQAYSIAVGDVSGDGWDDLVFLSRRFTPNPIDTRTEIYVAYQRGDGHLGAGVKIGDSGNNLA